MKLTKTEYTLLKEKIISEYKRKNPPPTKKPSTFEEFMKKVRQLAPLNIVIGVLCAVGILWVKGWQDLMYVLLYSVLWVTVISTVGAAFYGKK